MENKERLALLRTTLNLAKRLDRTERNFNGILVVLQEACSDDPYVKLVEGTLAVMRREIKSQRKGRWIRSTVAVGT